MVTLSYNCGFNATLENAFHYHSQGCVSACHQYVLPDATTNRLAANDDKSCNSPTFCMSTFVDFCSEWIVFEVPSYKDRVTLYLHTKMNMPHWTQT